MQFTNPPKLCAFAIIWLPLATVAVHTLLHVHRARRAAAHGGAAQADLPNGRPHAQALLKKHTAAVNWEKLPERLSISRPWSQNKL